MDWLGVQTVDYFHGLKLCDLKLNHAYVVSNTSLKNIAVYSMDNDCFECPYTKLINLDSDKVWQVDTSKSTTWRVMKDQVDDQINKNILRGMICQLEPSLGEYGVYHLDIGNCDLKEVSPHVNTYLPLSLFLLTLLLAGTLYNTAKYLMKYLRTNHAKNCTFSEKLLDDSQASLNVFKGMLLSLIIFLTTGAGGYTFLTKSYGGVTPADVMFFAYVWAIGFKIPVVIDKAIERGDGKWRISVNIFRKSIFVILMGVVVDSTTSQRIHPIVGLWSPLQRAGVAYFVAACTYGFTSKKYETKSEKTMKQVISNLMSSFWCWVIGAFLITMQIVWISTLLCYNKKSNTAFLYDFDELSSIRLKEITRRINTIFLAESNNVHIGQYYGFSKGLMGFISTTVFCFIGVKAGLVYSHHKLHGDRMKLWYLWGIVFLTGGLIFIGMSYAADYNMWPISIIPLLSAPCFFTISFIYKITEQYNITFSNLNSFGRLSVFILSGHLVFSSAFPFSWGLEFNNHLIYLIQNLWIVFLWYVISVGFKGNVLRFSV